MKKELKWVIKRSIHKASQIPYIGFPFRYAIETWRKAKTVTLLEEQVKILNENVTNYVQRERILEDGSKNFIISLPVTLRNIFQEIKASEKQLHELKQSIESSRCALSERMEFIRCELMLAMENRAPQTEKNNVEVLQKIISEQRLNAARQEKLKLNLGCGHIPLPDYINIDRRHLPGVDIVSEIHKLPVEAEEVDEIFSAHLLEHFPQEQLRRELLPYWVQLLKPNGIFHAVVPDAEMMISEYAKGSFEYEHLREVTFGKQEYDGNFHYNMFTANQLKVLFAEAGLSDFEVITRGRRNGHCLEMEVRARKQKTPDTLRTYQYA